LKGNVLSIEGEGGFPPAKKIPKKGKIREAAFTGREICNPGTRGKKNLTKGGIGTEKITSQARILIGTGRFSAPPSLRDSRRRAS